MPQLHKHFNVSRNAFNLLNLKTKTINYKTNKSLSWLFAQREKSYTLHASPEGILKRISNLPSSAGIWDDNDLELETLKGTKFSVRLIKLNAGVSPRLSSTLIGEVKSVNENVTIIETKTKSKTLLVFILTATAIGLIFLFQFFVLDYHIAKLWEGLVMLIVLPTVGVWYKRVSDNTVRERFEKFILKAVEKSTGG